MPVIVGGVAGGDVLFRGTTSALFSVRFTLVLVQPLFNPGVVLGVVTGCSLPSSGTRIELKPSVLPLTVTASPLMPEKMFTNPLQLLSLPIGQLNAVSVPITYAGDVIGFCAGSRLNVLLGKIRALVPVFGQLAPEGIGFVGVVHRSVVTTHK